MAAFVLAGCAGQPDLAAVTRHAAAYVWDAQSEDGGWHSDVHGLARSGQSWTAFTLFHLLQLPDSVYSVPEQRARRALAFIEARVDTAAVTGAALGLADSLVLDYPVYSTAFALRAYLRAAELGLVTPRQERLIPKMAAYLLDAQMTASRGVEPHQPAYGGWGAGPRPADSRRSDRPTAPAYADVAHTRRVIEALSAAERSDPSLRRATRDAFSFARVFLARVQKRGLPTYDGGFYYTPVLPDLNKAGLADSSGRFTAGPPRSYATATCDGLLALLAAGHAISSEPVRSAQAYLAAHDTLAHAAGLPQHRAAWREILFFYHLAGRAEVHARLSVPGSWRGEVLSLLRRRQRPDGSFLNPHGAPNREDDPIIATSLAIAALRHTF